MGDGEINLMKSSPTLENVLNWATLDYGCMSAAVWVELSTPGDFVVACDTRHYKDTRMNHTKLWITNEELAIALRVRGSGAIFSTVREIKEQHSNNNDKENSRSFEYSVMVIPIFGRDGIVSGVLLLRDKCKKNLQTETKTAQTSIEVFDSMDEVIGSYLSSVCTIHVMQHKIHASTQTDLKGVDIDRSKIWVDRSFSTPNRCCCFIVNFNRRCY